MKQFKLLLSIFLLSLSLHGDTNNTTIEESIVKIYTVSNVPSYISPWNSTIRRSSGSGCILKGDRILTNAHVVANNTFLEVKRYGKTKRYPAKAVFISHEADLAILKVEDKEFFKDSIPLKFGTLPHIQQKATVYGFPTGGNTLSVTTGIVSRIEHHRYVHSGQKFLSIQLDAAINPGNSGGPAISNGKIIGVVMQERANSQSIGYIVPVNMIKHFLDDIEDGVYNGFGDLGLTTQRLDSPTLRKMYHLDENSSGQLIINMVYNSCAKDIIKVGDIITHIDNHSIKNDGTVEFRYHEFTSYKYFIDLHQIGDEVELDVIRDRKRLKLQVTLANDADKSLLVKTKQYDRVPTYFIFGGYVFVPLTSNLLSTKYGSTFKLRYYATQWPTKERKDVVVLLKVLASKLSQGNYNISLWAIDKINNEKFSTYKEFYEKLYNSKGDFILLEDDEGAKIAIDRNSSIKIQNDILKRYNIKYDRSIDLR
jgi:S1-C subfamily serine protease